MQSPSIVPIKIVLVEDFHAESEVILRELRDAELLIEQRIARSEAELETVLHEFDADVILCPYSLKGTNALKLLGVVRKKDVDVPFILLAFDLSEDIAIDLLAEGVEDYILRSTIKRLPVAIRKALQRHKTQLELKLSEAQLRKSESFLKEAQSLAKLGSWEWLAEGHKVWWSEETSKIYELEPTDASMEFVLGYTHPEDRDNPKIVCRHIDSNVFNPVINYRLLLPSGKIKHVISTARPSYDDQGNIFKLIGTLQDITGQKQVELEISKGRELLAVGERVSNSGSFELNLKTRKTIWSENLYRITGIDPKVKITFEGFISHVHADDRELFRKTLRRSISSNKGKPFVYRFVRPDNGEMIYLQANGNPLGDGATWVGSIQDISDRILTQLELERSQQSLMEAQRIAKVGNWEWDTGSKHVWWSDEMFNIYETDKKEITISDVKMFIHPEDRKMVDELTANDLGTEIEPVIEYRILLADGKIKHVVSSAKQVFDSNGKVIRLIGTLQDVTEKVEADLQSKADQIQRELTLQAAHIGVWHWLLKENRLIWDDRCFEIYGLEKKELIPQDFVDLLHPDDREQIQEKIATALSTGNYKSEYRLDTKDGTKHLHSRGRVTFDEEGNPERMDGIIIDMTDRHNIEEALRESEQLFRDMAESITEVFWLTDWELNEVLYVSPQYEKLYGLSLESLYENSSSWSKAIHPDDLERATLEFRNNAVKGTYDIEYRLRMKDGTVKWVRDRAFPVYNSEGNVSRIAGITEDITKRKLDKEQIETLSLVASETVNGVLIHNPDGTVVWANKGFERITGYSPEEMIGKEPWSVVSGPETDKSLIETTYEHIQAGRPFSSDNKLQHKNGNSVWVNVSFTPIVDDYGNITKVVSIGMDITKQKETEHQQREMLEKLEKANEELKRRAGG